MIAVLGGLWTGVSFVFSHWSDLVSLAKTVKGWVNQFEDYEQRKAALKQLNGGLQKAHNDKDTSGLEKLFNPDASNPSGVPPG